MLVGADVGIPIRRSRYVEFDLKAHFEDPVRPRPAPRQHICMENRSSPHIPSAARGLPVEVAIRKYSLTCRRLLALN